MCWGDSAVLIVFTLSVICGHTVASLSSAVTELGEIYVVEKLRSILNSGNNQSPNMKQINKLEFHIEVPQKMFNFCFVFFLFC